MALDPHRALEPLDPGRDLGALPGAAGAERDGLEQARLALAVTGGVRVGQCGLGLAVRPEPPRRPQVQPGDLLGLLLLELGRSASRNRWW